MEPKKVVTTCEKHRGAGSELWSGDDRMGKPSEIYLSLTITEYIGYVLGTQGTETS